MDTLYAYISTQQKCLRLSIVEKEKNLKNSQHVKITNTVKWLESFAKRMKQGLTINTFKPSSQTDYKQEKLTSQTCEKRDEEDIYDEFII